MRRSILRKRTEELTFSEKGSLTTLNSVKDSGCGIGTLVQIAPLEQVPFRTSMRVWGSPHYLVEKLIKHLTNGMWHAQLDNRKPLGQVKISQSKLVQNPFNSSIKKITIKLKTQISWKLKAL